tara:strand:- start:134 stop:868 length:735 start_codon:yes stop_codon:yes gene_type:complete
MSKYQKNFQNDRRILAKQDYEKATYEKGNIKNRFNQAEKKYYVEKNDESGYNSVLKTRHLAEAKEITKKWKDLFDDKYDDIMDLIKYYNSQFHYVPQMNDMEKIYKEKNDKLYGKIEEDINKSNVSKRLADYYDNLSNIQYLVNYYLKYLYWGLYIVMIGFFIYKKQYKNIKTYPFLIFFGVFPYFFLNKFVSIVYKNMSHVQIDALYLTLLFAVGIIFAVISGLSNLVLKKTLPVAVAVPLTS